MLRWWKKKKAANDDAEIQSLEELTWYNNEDVTDLTTEQIIFFKNKHIHALLILKDANKSLMEALKRKKQTMFFSNYESKEPSAWEIHRIHENNFCSSTLSKSSSQTSIEIGVDNQLLFYISIYSTNIPYHDHIREQLCPSLSFPHTIEEFFDKKQLMISNIHLSNVNTFLDAIKDVLNGQPHLADLISKETTRILLGFNLTEVEKHYKLYQSDFNSSENSLNPIK